MWRQAIGGLAVVLAALVMAPAAHAQDQSFSFTIGGFVPRGEDSRVTDDVLNADRCIDVTVLCEPLLFRVQDFNNVSVSGEWLVGIGEYVEAGAGIGFYQRTVPSIYEFLTNDDGSEIEQDLKLRIVPLTATIRFVPTGRHAPIQPYIGAGIGLFNWRYTESGSFVDVTDGTVFRANFEADGNTVGPVVLGGVKAPVGDNFLIGGEVRYQRADDDLPDDFVGSKIDLSGFTYQAVLQFRF
jgi:opacity protein-like surface antigen